MVLFIILIALNCLNILYSLFGVFFSLKYDSHKARHLADFAYSLSLLMISVENTILPMGVMYLFVMIDIVTTYGLMQYERKELM